MDLGGIGSASVVQGHIDTALDLVPDHIGAKRKDLRLFDRYDSRPARIARMSSVSCSSWSV
jgi:hypothetical protein